MKNLFPDEEFEPATLAYVTPQFLDNIAKIQRQQRNARWHLDWLVRLSDVLSTDRPYRTPGADPRVVDRWPFPAISSPRGLIWLGGSTDQEVSIDHLMQRYPDPRDVPQQELRTGHQVPVGMERAAYLDWWRRAHDVSRELVEGGVQVLWTPEGEWATDWPDYDVVWHPPSATALSGGITPDWDGAVELQRRLVAPFLRRAQAHGVVLERMAAATDTPESSADPDAADATRPLVVSEVRTWTSVLAPVYLQLLEGLRRVTEGFRGAATCKECGHPFLTLDARRSVFCRDRERLRYAKRAQRARMTTEGPDA